MPDTKRLILVWAPLVAVVTVMCAVCLLFNAPPSPLRSALAHRTDAVIETWYSQSWHLFGPPVPEGTWQVALRVRFAHRNGEPDTREWHLTGEVDSSGGARPRRGGEEGRPLDCFGAHAHGAGPAARPGGDTSPLTLRTLCRDAFGPSRIRGPSAPRWDRYFSTRARRLARGEAGDTRPIKAVRVQLRREGPTPRAERDTPPRSHQAPELVHDTDWRPYIPAQAR